VPRADRDDHLLRCVAAILDRCGVDMLLVGNSLGMVLQGHAPTLPMTLEQMLHRHPPRFVRDCLAGQESIAYVVRAYVAAVRDSSFPAAEHAC
jgi:ketopantoate hydroxymethyltransferase